MNTTDMWAKPTVRRKVRSNFGTSHLVGIEQGFARISAISAFNRPVIERALRKAIPILIIAFLVSVALARGFSLISSHTRMESAVQHTTALTSAMAYATLENEPALFEPNNSGAAAAKLKALLNLTGANSATDLMIIDTSGNVLATGELGDSLTGRSLASVFLDLTSAHRSNTHSGLAETNIDGMPYQVSMHLVGDNGGMVIALHSMKQMNALWRAEVNFNVMLFATMALLLLVVIYAYYGQLSRADKTSNLMSEERQARETMLANGDAGLWSFDLKSQSVFLDGSACVALGFNSSAQNLSYRDLLALIHPDDRTGLARSLRPTDNGLIEATFRLKQQSAQYVLFEIRAHAASINGQISILGAAIRACTSQHHELDAATKRARQLQATLDATPLAIALWHKDGRLSAANQKFREAYTLGKSTNNIRLKDVQANNTFPTVIAHRSTNGAHTSAEVKTTNGSWLHLCESQTAAGNVVTVGTDITRFKNDQNRLQCEQERLRNKCTELAFSRRKLEQKYTALARTIENSPRPKNMRTNWGADLINQTSTVVPAEIRTPLTAVLDFSELLIAETGSHLLPDSKLHEYACCIQQSGKALHAIVERYESNQYYTAMHDANMIAGSIIRRTVG